MSDFFLLSGIAFLFRFLPVFLIIYYIAPKKWRHSILFLGSLIFYALGEQKWVFLLLVLTIINFIAGQALFLYKRRGKKKRRQRQGSLRAKERRTTLFWIVLLDVGILVAFKIWAGLSADFAIPVGMSFYLFKMLSYQFDLYRGGIARKPTFIETAAYFTMFPQITQGPLMHYEDGFSTETRTVSDTVERFEEGLFYLALGFSMKLLLADKLAAFWQELSTIGYESLSTPLAWIGAYAFTFRLYFDFWGYSLIAGGIGVMLGFPFIRNFYHPYAAKSISDFYRRWHTTLGAWFRDYVYIPLGGSRKGGMRTVINLLIVWLLTGFWHGGTLNFILWGLILGIIIVLEKSALGRLLKKLPLYGHIKVWVLIPLTWVVFAISDLSQLTVYFGRLFPFFDIGKTLNPMDYMKYISMLIPIFLVSILLTIPKVYAFILKKRDSLLMCLILAALFWLGVYSAVISGGQAFMYFNF